jgi:hypothetical protein
MDETRATARLPHLDVEIVHRRRPQAEQLAISLRATPSFEALGRHLEAQASFWLTLNPWLGGWQRLLQAAGQPWLTAASDDPAPRPLGPDR